MVGGFGPLFSDSGRRFVIRGIILNWRVCLAESCLGVSDTCCTLGM